MTGPDNAARLTRLGLVLKLREVEMAPLLVAAATIDAGRLVVGASVNGQRLELIMPYHPAAFTAVAAAPPPADVPAGSKLRVRVGADGLSVGIAKTSPIGPHAAVDDVAPPAIAAAWFDIVEQLCAICQGRVVGRTAFVGDGKAILDIHYPDRDREGEVFLLEGIDQLAGELGISAAQRRLWQRMHPQLSGGREVALSTSCAPTGVSPYFGIGYPIPSWEVALKLGEGLVLDTAEARQVPTALGQLAGLFGTDQPQSLELVLGPHEPPDVIVWTGLSSML